MRLPGPAASGPGPQRFPFFIFNRFLQDRGGTSMLLHRGLEVQVKIEVVKLEDVTAPATAKAVPKVLPGCDHKGRGLVFVVREGASADVSLPVFFKCRSCGLLNVGLEIHAGFDGVDPGLFYHFGIFLVSTSVVNLGHGLKTGTHMDGIPYIHGKAQVEPVKKARPGPS